MTHATWHRNSDPSSDHPNAVVSKWCHSTRLIWSECGARPVVPQLQEHQQELPKPAPLRAFALSSLLFSQTYGSSFSLFSPISASIFGFYFPHCSLTSSVIFGKNFRYSFDPEETYSKFISNSKRKRRLMACEALEDKFNARKPHFYELYSTESAAEKLVASFLFSLLCFVLIRS